MTTRPVFRTLDAASSPGADHALDRGGRVRVVPAVPERDHAASAVLAGRAGNDVVPRCDRRIDPAARVARAAPARRRTAVAPLAARRSVAGRNARVRQRGVVLRGARASLVHAHIVGVVLALGYAWASIEARHPVVAGLALGARR